MNAITTRRKSAFDYSAIAAYTGVAAAIAFIGAMTVGAIDGASPRGHVMTAAGTNVAKLISATEGAGGTTEIR